MAESLPASTTVALTPMRVGVEATKLLQEKRGIGRYVRNVLRHMVALRADLELTLFIRTLQDADALRAQLQDFDAPLAARATFAAIDALPTSTVDVVWYPWNWLHPRPRHAAAVTTICDLVPMLQLDHRWWKVIKRWKYRRRFLRTVHHSDVVIAISAFTAREIERCLHYPAGNVVVTLLAADDLAEHHGTDDSATLDRLTIDGPFFMAVGAHEARKNLQVLFRAMAILHSRGVNAPLVLCGPGAALARIAKQVQAPWLRFAGFVPDAELGTLYRRATALVFPSRYEGFGLPALEALASGGRVICADESSLPEVVGTAALRFSWNDADTLAQHMERLVTDAPLREEMVVRGLQHASRFTWERTAAETLAAFDRAVRQRR